MYKLYSVLGLLISLITNAQDSTQKNNPFSFGGYVEAYYSYDFNKPVDNNRPSFIYSHNRHNEFNVNLGLLKASYNTDWIRGNIALATGTYMNANYAAEPGVLKNIYEANAGVKISKSKNLWIDIGIMPSHIGFESARSYDCWNLTRSIIADNTPYYESGAKVTYTSDNNKWMVSALALNGWQRIQRVSGNSLMSWGAQLQFKPSENITLNYSGFAGSDKPDSARQWRYYHNTYAIFQLNSHWGLTLDFDFGQEQKAKESKSLSNLYGTAVILRYSFAGSWALAARGEFYSDEDGVIINTGTPNGFKTVGASLNIDKSINSHLLWRAEIRTFQSKDDIFTKGSALTNTNTALTTSLAISF